ncbi:L,D-transpeptidase family protein [Shewanella cyperi]|uniref:L,D-transpeptidase family protein n=1 Tax=Shewanella cyperi TaxID=2814292 RepID=A0A974XHP2_9GAMM|nr:L,D-transpeptidase family protein [Shewanella cyperi]QSX28570.1 L,D-transpeptidase family protein [Shewanella cyperi]
MSLRLLSPGIGLAGAFFLGYLCLSAGSVWADSNTVAAGKVLAEHARLLALASQDPLLERYARELESESLSAQLEYFDVAAEAIADFWRVRQVGLPANGAGGDKLSQATGLEPFPNQFMLTVNRVRQLLWLDSHAEWPLISPQGLLRPGDSHGSIPQIGQRLWLLGDMKAKPDTSQIYEERLKLAVLRFQARHGLKQDAIVGPLTLQWLNRSPLERAQILARNFVQFVMDSSALGKRYLLVNIPAFELVLVDGGEEILRSRVIVGRTYRQTPLLSGEISNVVLNPSWRVPKKLMRKDVLPKVRKDGSYLREKQFDVFDSQGQLVEHSDADWQQLAASQFPFNLEQRPGVHNALGQFKFHFANEASVYLHDTPEKELFEHSDRALSSGCIRVDKVRELANWFADNLIRDRRTWDSMLGGRERTQWFSLTEKVPVHLVYWTAWMDGEQQAQFRNDIYNLRQNTPMLTAAQP